MAQTVSKKFACSADIQLNVSEIEARYGFLHEGYLGKTASERFLKE